MELKEAKARRGKLYIPIDVSFNTRRGMCALSDMSSSFDSQSGNIIIEY